MKKSSIATVLVTMLCLLAGASVVQAQVYEGTLRVYMVEPVGRWTYNCTGENTGNAVLGYSILETLDIPDGSTVTFDADWDASASTGFSGVTADNLAAVAAVFRADYNLIDSYPPYGQYFERHLVDASATAFPAVPGADVAEDGYTHSVFCEEATARTCDNCPSVAANLHRSREELGTSMNYVALVKDMNSIATNVAKVRLAEYNCIATPEIFYDGGLEMQIVDTTYATMQSHLDAVGASDVDDIGLVLRVEEHNSSDRFLVTVRIGNGVPANGLAAPPDVPTGDGSGAALDTLDFQATATDPDGDSLYYQFDFGDGVTSDWGGPYASGADCDPVEHVFAVDGHYDVRVRTKDVWATTSNWSPTLAVTVDVASDVRRRDSDRLPTATSLANYPNPFNPSTIIGFSLPRAGHVELSIYNVLGERVRTLVNETLAAGEYEISWDGSSDQQARVASGLYFYRLTTEQSGISRKMLLLK